MANVGGDFAPCALGSRSAFAKQNSGLGRARRRPRRFRRIAVMRRGGRLGNVGRRAFPRRAAAR